MEWGKFLAFYFIFFCCGLSIEAFYEGYIYFHMVIGTVLYILMFMRISDMIKKYLLHFYARKDTKNYERKFLYLYNRLNLRHAFLQTYNDMPKNFFVWFYPTIKVSPYMTLFFSLDFIFLTYASYCFLFDMYYCGVAFYINVIHGLHFFFLVIVYTIVFMLYSSVFFYFFDLINLEFFTTYNVQNYRSSRQYSILDNIPQRPTIKEFMLWCTSQFRLILIYLFGLKLLSIYTYVKMYPVPRYSIMFFNLFEF